MRFVVGFVNAVSCIGLCIDIIKISYYYYYYYSYYYYYYYHYPIHHAISK